MKISVITATYNSGSTLRDTIASVLRQSYAEVEYIIVDGGSKDETLEIIREYEPRFGGRMRWISEPDGGIYDAMNKGISMSTGEIVGILNSDDFYTSDEILSKVAESMSGGEIEGVYGDIHFVNDADLDVIVRNYTSKYFRRWQMRLGFMLAHPSFYCLRSVYDRYGLYDATYRIAADFEFLLRVIFIHRIRVKYLPIDFVTMRTGGASTSGLKSHKRVLQEHLRAYRQNGVYSNIIFESLRYPIKLMSIVVYRIKRKLRRK